MKNILTIDVEDYFHVTAFSQVIPRSDWDQLESRVERNTQTILDILAARNVRATFFILGWLVDRYPTLIKDIQIAGHEVACHGYSHQLVYEQTPEEFRQETRKAKNRLEDLTGVAVTSYRAASYSITERSIWALEILAQEGFQYDSSIFPVTHDRYGIPGAPTRPFSINFGPGSQLLELPLSALRILGIRFPVAGGGYFRLLPYPVIKRAYRRINHKEGLPVVFYLHPWEFDPLQPVQAVDRLTRFRHYHNLHKTEGRFQRLLEDFNFGPLQEVANSIEFPPRDLHHLLRQEE